MIYAAATILGVIVVIFVWVICTLAYGAVQEEDDDDFL